jgi:hypothetical protein
MATIHCTQELGKIKEDQIKNIARSEEAEE